MSTVGFLWRHIRRYLIWVIVALAAVLTYAVATAGMVSLIEPLFGEVLMSSEGAPVTLQLAGPEESADSQATGEEGGPLAGLTSRFNLKRRLNETYLRLKERLGIDAQNVVYFVPVLFLLVFFTRSLSNFISGYSFQRIGLGMTADMRNALFRRVLSQSSRFHAEHRSGELLSRVVNDVTVIETAVSTRVLDLFQQTFTLLALVLLLFSTHMKLALVCLVVAPLFLFTIMRFGRGMRHTSHRSQERMADLSRLLTEAVRGHRVVKAFGMEDFESRRFAQATRRLLGAKLRAQVFAHVSGPVVEVIGAVASVAFLIYAGWAIRAGQVTGPLMVQFLANLLLLYDPIRKLNKVNLMIQEALAAVHRVAGLLAEPLDIHDRPGATEVAEVRRGVSFEGVTFGYRDEPVILDLSLEIRKGEIVALVGPSGAGKSTVVNLLARFFDPDEGRVAIDGLDLRDIKLASLTGLIGIVTQETVLFDDTIRNNIAYGRSDLPLETVREAAAAAYADDFIRELPQGYESQIGEAGHQLSGGQRQRLSVARALLKDAPILILDEATSHLDSESEALVQKALYNLMRGRTTLVIAHRLSTIAIADRIVVLEAGRISETGTHDELLAAGGTYKRLYDLQFKV